MKTTPLPIPDRVKDETVTVPRGDCQISIPLVGSHY